MIDSLPLLTAVTKWKVPINGVIWSKRDTCTHCAFLQTIYYILLVVGTSTVEPRFYEIYGQQQCNLNLKHRKLETRLKDTALKIDW